MNRFTEKARAGRSTALAEQEEKVDTGLLPTASKIKFKSSRNFELVPFISSRAQTQTSVWLH
ncbi:MAG: hypothetical protein V3V25_10375 [Paracoccaceae bacterium]